jgi:predicted MFS family arabinose efflux permease
MPWVAVLASATLLAITTGTRQSLGLFVRPLAATGLGIETISLILAVGQFFWGASQPAFGILAERIGTLRVVLLGGLVLATGLAITPFLTSAGGLLASLGVLSAVGCGAGSFALLIGAVARRVPTPHQPMAAAWINAGGSIGQLIFAPLSQAIIAAAGWAAGMWTLAGAALLTLLIARPAVGSSASEAIDAAREPATPLRELLRPAFASRSYWYLHLGFFTCGFHIAFLVTHLPSEVALCGLSGSAAGAALGLIGLMNVVGTLSVGWLSRRMPLRMLLVAVYATRVLAIGVYLMSPKTLWTLYLFAAVLGLTWLATVPLTAGLVSKLYGSRHVSTLFGLTFLSHQTGGFFGAWLGGIAVSLTGNYHWIWGLDMLLAAVAAIATLPVREIAFIPPAAAAVP